MPKKCASNEDYVRSHCRRRSKSSRSSSRTSKRRSPSRRSKSKRSKSRKASTRTLAVTYGAPNTYYTSNVDCVPDYIDPIAFANQQTTGKATYGPTAHFKPPAEIERAIKQYQHDVAHHVEQLNRFKVDKCKDELKIEAAMFNIDAAKKRVDERLNKYTQPSYDYRGHIDQIHDIARQVADMEYPCNKVDPYTVNCADGRSYQTLSQKFVDQSNLMNRKQELANKINTPMKYRPV